MYVRRSYGELSVACDKKNYSGIIAVQSSTKAMAYGNLLFGGIIGGAIDAKSGSAYDYPHEIYVQLKQKND